MRFDDIKLQAILRRQHDRVEVLDCYGNELTSSSPAEALAKVDCGGYYGVGNKRRIRYIRETPEGTFRRRVAEKEVRIARRILVNAAMQWTGREPVRSVPDR